MGGVTIPRAEHEEAEEDAAAARRISPNSEALLRARLLKIELPSSSASSICSNSLVSGRPTAHSGEDPGDGLLYGDSYSPKSTPSTPHSVAAGNSAYFAGAAADKLNGSFGCFGRGDAAGADHYSYAHHRKAKFDQCARQCSLVFSAGSPGAEGRAAGANNLYVAGDAVARSREALAAHGITHVVNCCGYVCKNHFEQEGIEYLTLCLEDSPTEEIVTVLYKVFEFIDAAINAGEGAPRRREGAGGGNNVLVHCTMGVSRSVSICIAYMMQMTQNFDYELLFKRVKRKRGARRARARARRRVHRVRTPAYADGRG